MLNEFYDLYIVNAIKIVITVIRTTIDYKITNKYI